MADNGNMHLAAVVLYDYGVDAYQDTRAMFDYVFQNFEKVPVSETENTDEIVSFQNNDAYVVLPKGTELSQVDREVILTDQGIRSGRIIYTCRDQVVGNADVSLSEEYYQKLLGGDAAKSGSKEIENNGSTPQDAEKDANQTKDLKKENNKDIKLVIGISAAAIFLAIVIISIADSKKRRKRRRK